MFAAYPGAYGGRSEREGRLRNGTFGRWADTFRERCVSVPMSVCPRHATRLVFGGAESCTSKTDGLVLEHE